MSSFNTLYTVRSGLFAQRRALDVVGQNIANANTAGYSRQEVTFAAAEPSQVIRGAGRGVDEGTAVRYRDEFLDRQFRTKSGALGYQETRSTHLAQVEQVLDALSDEGLRTALDDFFNAWQNLNLRPNDQGVRALVVSAASQFLQVARTAQNDLAQLRQSMDEAAANKVFEVNTAAAQVAELNIALAGGGSSQQKTAELQDRRDLLIDSISRLAGGTFVKQSAGSVSVQVGSLPAVDGSAVLSLDETRALEADLDSDPSLTSIQQVVSTFTWNGTGTTVPFGGEIGALLELRDQAVPAYMKYLDTLVRTVATAVNTAHTVGVPAASQVNIFTFPTATWMDVQVNPAVLSDPSVILASATWPVEPGDGERARAIAGLRDAAILTGPPVGAQQVTPGEYLRTIAAQAGLDVQQANRRRDGAALQTDQVDQQRKAVSGVSLDDEMTKMIQYQQAYNAAARMMTAVDEMLDTIINRVGLAGR